MPTRFAETIDGESDFTYFEGLPEQKARQAKRLRFLEAYKDRRLLQVARDGHPRSEHTRIWIGLLADLSGLRAKPGEISAADVAQHLRPITNSLAHSVAAGYFDGDRRIFIEFDARPKRITGEVWRNFNSASYEFAVDQFLARSWASVATWQKWCVCAGLQFPENLQTPSQVRDLGASPPKLRDVDSDEAFAILASSPAELTLNNAASQLQKKGFRYRRSLYGPSAPELIDIARKVPNRKERGRPLKKK